MQRRTKKKIREIGKGSALHLFFIVLVILTLFPVLYALGASFSDSGAVMSDSLSLFPTALTFDNYATLFKDNAIGVWFLNSIILALATVFLSLAVAIPAAYAFSRRQFAGKKAILRTIIILNAFPSILSMAAIYRILMTVGLLNTRLGLILVYTGTMAIFGLWNLKGYFDTIPNEIEEAGLIDGCNNFQIVTRIVLPLARPAIAVTAMMV